MSLWHTELEIALWALEDLPLESTGLTTVISNLLSQAFVYHQCRIGFVEDRYSRMVTLLHSWIELPDGWCIDLTLRKWLDDDDDIPHGVFRFFDHPRVKYQGSPLRVAYSRPRLPLIPDEACHPFHAKAATDSTAKLPPRQAA